MISLKRLIESNQEELIAGALRAYRAALDAMGKACAKACPALGAHLQTGLGNLMRQLPDHATLEQLQQTQERVGIDLHHWGEQFAGYYQRKTEEFKEILIIMAHTAELVGDRDQRNTTELTEFTSSLHSLATMDDLATIRDSLVSRANQLQDSVTRMTQDGDAMVAKMRGELRHYQAKLEEAERLACIDSLTGLQNRRGIESLLEARVRQGRAFSVVLLDLNAFKQINDTHGHAAGDDVLRQFAAELRAAFRATDDVGRWGGDEFVVVLECAQEEAIRHVDRARKWVFGEYTVRGDRPPVKLAVDAAIGTAAWQANDTVAAVFARADANMYRDKKSPGRVAKPA
ncbi:MAG: GGDEF domain-containing protein [Candidatus Solibacter sp.]